MPRDGVKEVDGTGIVTQCEASVDLTIPSEGGSPASRPRVTETAERETMDERDHCVCKMCVRGRLTRI